MSQNKASFYIKLFFVGAIMISAWSISQLSDTSEAEGHSDIFQAKQNPIEVELKALVSAEVPPTQSGPIQESKVSYEPGLANSLVETVEDSRSDMGTKGERTFVAREFDFPEKYPGANIEILEEKKIEFMVHELGMFIEDAKNVSETYQAMMEEVNKLILSKRDLDEESLQVINKHENWLLDRLGKEDYDKYSFFVRNEMEELQSKQTRYINSIRSGTNTQ